MYNYKKMLALWLVGNYILNKEMDRTPRRILKHLRHPMLRVAHSRVRKQASLKKPHC